MMYTAYKKQFNRLPLSEKRSASQTMTIERQGLFKKLNIFNDLIFKQHLAKLDRF